MFVIINLNVVAGKIANIICQIILILTTFQLTITNGFDRNIKNFEGEERRENGQGKRRLKRHAAQGCRGREGPGYQVEGNTTARTGMDGGGWRE